MLRLSFYRMPRWILLILSASFALNVLAQRNVALEHKLLSNEDWKTGTVQLDDQSNIKCLLKYNRFNNILSFKTINGIIDVTAKEIQRFSIEEDSGVRNFISSPKGKAVDENPTRFFFEILVDCGGFKLVTQEATSASSHPVWKNAPQSGGGSSRYYVGDAEMLVFDECLYFIDSAGNVRHYMTMTAYYSTVKNKEIKYIADKKLISYYLRDRYAEVKAYAKKNKLSFRDRNDLTLILNYFKKLESS